MNKNFYNILNQRMINRTPAYDEFAIFFIVFSIVPHVMWRNNNAGNIYTLKIIGGVMCILLLLRDLSDLKYKKYLGVYWFICLLFCLPVTSTIILLQNNISEWSLINFLFSILLLSLLVDWDIFLILLIKGLVVALFYSKLSSNIDILSIFTMEQIDWLIYTIIFTITISIVFIRKYELFYSLSLMKAKNAFGMICHEIKNPLAALKLLNLNLLNSRCMFDVEAKRNYLIKCDAVVKDIEYIIDDILVKLQIDKTLQLDKIELQETIQDIIDKYPFQNKEKSHIKMQITQDFKFWGNARIFKFVIFNIINNSLYYTSIVQDLKIVFYTINTANHNVLVIEDNGPGIQELDIPFIFQRFYSKKNNGVGLGMFFCKQSMLKFGGDILCESEVGKYTKFKLFFPIIKEGI